MHFFLRWQFYSVIWANLMRDEKLLEILLYGNKRFDTKTNKNILMRTLKFI